MMKTIKSIYYFLASLPGELALMQEVKEREEVITRMKNAVDNSHITYVLTKDTRDVKTNIFFKDMVGRLFCNADRLSDAELIDEIKWSYTKKGTPLVIVTANKDRQLKDIVVQHCSVVIDIRDKDYALLKNRTNGLFEPMYTPRGF